MKFIDRYKKAVKFEQFSHYGDTIMMIGDKPDTCVICKEDTHFCTISFECGICSEECLDFLWEEYYNACRESDRKVQVTKDMATDAGDPSLEGEWIEW
jgi:hypothetical protein